MIKPSKKVAAVAAGGVLAVATAGGAYAFWTTTGGGNGSASTVTAADVAALTVAQLNGDASHAALTPMYPGDTAQTVFAKVTNPADSKSSVFVKSVTVKLSVTPASPSLTCGIGDYKLGGAVANADGVVLPIGTDGAGQELAIGASTADLSTSIQFNNKDSAQDGCKGASVALAYTTNAA